MTKAWIRKTTLIFFNQFHIKNIESSIMFAMSAQKKPPKFQFYKFRSSSDSTLSHLLFFSK